MDTHMGKFKSENISLLQPEHAIMSDENGNPYAPTSFVDIYGQGIVDHLIDSNDLRSYWYVSQMFHDPHVEDIKRITETVKDIEGLVNSNGGRKKATTYDTDNESEILDSVRGIHPEVIGGMLREIGEQISKDMIEDVVTDVIVETGIPYDENIVQTVNIIQ